MKITLLSDSEIDQICQIDQAESPQTLAAMMAKPAFAGMGLHIENQLIGFIYGWVIQDQGEIVQITITKDQRRKGYGAKLLTKFLTEYALNTCWLDLREDNKAALNLYQSVGFVEDGQRKGYYQSATQDGMAIDAILMHWKR